MQHLPKKGFRDQWNRYGKIPINVPLLPGPQVGNNAFDRHRPEQSELYRLVQDHAASFFAQVEQATGVGLPKFVKEEFDAFLECGIPRSVGPDHPSHDEATGAARYSDRRAGRAVYVRRWGGSRRGRSAEATTSGLGGVAYRLW